MARIAARTRTDRIYCFRHGETKYNERKLVSGQHDTVLSARGREAAMSLRESLPQPLDLIVCSGLTRAIETMRLSVPPHIQASCPIWADRRLNEVNLGVLQGKKSVFIHQFAAGELSWAPAGGESYRDAAQRVFSSVVDIYDELAAGGGPPKRVAVFCHAGVMRIIGTLIDPHADSRNVFKSSAKNLECLVVSATDVSLPAFWREGDRGRDGQDNPRQDQRS
jgi:broad specificity phosphatase PhoE